VKLVADANVLLSALIGGRARLAILHPEVSELLTTEATLDEVREYVLDLAHRRRLPTDVVLASLAALPVQVVERAVYQPSMAEAERRIGWRDPDDVELLALALQSGGRLWSNDRDFNETGVPRYTTAQLLKALAVR